MKAKISCIIPTCDRKKLLNITINSVINQSVLPNEILIINNGKNKINKNYIKIKNLKKYKITIYNLPKYIGTAQAYNFGSSVASGDYLAFLDDDDLWDKNYIKNISNNINNKFKMYLGRIDLLKNGKIYRYKNPFGKMNLKNLFRNNPGIMCSNICVQKKAFFNVSGFSTDIKVGLDKALAVEFILKNFKIKVIEKAQVINRFHDGPRMTGDILNLRKSQINFYKKYKYKMKFVQKFRLILKILYLTIFKKRYVFSSDN